MTSNHILVSSLVNHAYLLGNCTNCNAFVQTYSSFEMWLLFAWLQGFPKAVYTWGGQVPGDKVLMGGDS